MRSSKFCLHPAGDTPSSCRLFDAIVSHCVPVIVSDQIELPFEDQIDYSQFSLFFSFKEALQPGYMIDHLRKFPKQKWTEMWRQLKNNSHHYEFQYPPKRGDAVNMLWRQIKHKLPEVTLSIHRSRRLKIPDWWHRRWFLELSAWILYIHSLKFLLLSLKGIRRISLPHHVLSPHFIIEYCGSFSLWFVSVSLTHHVLSPHFMIEYCGSFNLWFVSVVYARPHSGAQLSLTFKWRSSDILTPPNVCNCCFFGLFLDFVVGKWRYAPRTGEEDKERYFNFIFILHFTNLICAMLLPIELKLIIKFINVQRVQITVFIHFPCDTSCL